MYSTTASSSCDLACRAAWLLGFRALCGRCGAGTRRTPTRPRCGRSARPEAAMLIDVAAHLGRSGSSSLAKTRSPTSRSRSRGAARSSPGRNRTATLKRQPHAALAQFHGVLPRSRHDAENLLSPGQHGEMRFALSNRGRQSGGRGLRRIPPHLQLERQLGGDVCPFPRATADTDRPAQSLNAVSKAY
jgi:hypothetical protein